MQWLCVALAVTVLSVGDARLVFPSGSDMGYILPDEPEPARYMDTANWLGDVEEYGGEPLRGAREAASSPVEEFFRSLQGGVREEASSSDASGQQQQGVLHRGWVERAAPQQPATVLGSPPKDLPDSLKDDKHGVVMGVSHVKCDNAKVNLTMDWDNSAINYTCFNQKRHRLPIQKNLKSVLKCTDLAKNYTPQHICMNQKIHYNSTLPTYGPHRPLWPVFGEYQFVPVQRWLHSLEHGGIVMLYDPCTEPLLVHRLRKLLKGCFRKHIITPYTLLTKKRPLALMAWGCSLEMAAVNEREVKTFIKTRALHGPEGHYPKDGSFKEGLLHKVIFAESLEVLVMALKALHEEAKPLGLEVSWLKTKVQVFGDLLDEAVQSVHACGEDI
ncbi:hypothetical protein GWK47_011932 [Chionoecetes opilio]|uniref:Uncharacterized protein n=1 Tax=Chionoecetes opilio TaxID=41210 RepID=A0A8J4XVG1_CHIOP|nr:hypothetical protein GWK47_011932 [Chionoecetes opilio]